MASPSLPYRGPSALEDRHMHPSHLLILLITSAGALLWGTVLITGRQTTSFETYSLLVGMFGAASAAFVFFRVHGSRLSLFSIPVFITIMVLVRFGLIPYYCFAEPDALNRIFLGQYGLLVRALLFVVLGMGAFWVGAASFSRARPGNLELAGGLTDCGTRNLHDSILAIAAGLYCAVFITKMYLLHAHLLSYAMSWIAYQSSLASLQVLGVISSLGSCVLIVFAIERFSNPGDPKRKLLFFCVFFSECGWGLISGDKHLLLENFFLVAIVASIVQHRVRISWLLAPLLGLILFYPLSNAYRTLLRRNGGATSVTSAAVLGSEALSQAAEQKSGLDGWIDAGWKASLFRLDLLQSLGMVLSLGSRARFLHGKEQWWMIPYYPFVPRFIWRTKPVLNEGARFSVALGYGDRTSTATTYPGDLYADYGLPGILIGMLLLGAVSQWISDAVARTPDSRHIFVYTAIFPIIIDMEIGAFEFWSRLIKMFVIFSVIAFVIYGPRRRFRLSATRGMPEAG